MSRSNSPLFLPVILFSLQVFQPVMAQDAIEEIVVTALKRTGTLQDTPIAISALTNEGLERVGADDFVDFVGSVPGLTLRDNGPRRHAADHSRHRKSR